MTNNEIKKELLARLVKQSAEVTLTLDALEAIDNLVDHQPSLGLQLSSMIEGNAELYRAVAKAKVTMSTSSNSE